MSLLLLLAGAGEGGGPPEPPEGGHPGWKPKRRRPQPGVIQPATKIRDEDEAEDAFTLFF